MMQIYLNIKILLYTAIPTWFIYAYLISDKVKSPWLFIMFPLAIFSIPIMLYTAIFKDLSILIMLLILYAYYLCRAMRSRLNRAETAIIPIIQIAFLLYFVEKYGEVCLIAP